MRSHIFHFSIMDLQMENQLFQGNKEASIPYHGSPNGEPTATREPSSIKFSMLEIQYRISYISIYYLGSPNGEPTVSGESKALGSPLWRSINLVNNILYFILVSWISKWRTNCFKGIKTLQFQIMDLQMENQLLQGNLAVSGSPCWRSNTIVNNILYFILVSWISKWRTNCFRGTKKLQFRIMDLQMENQMLQGNQAALGSPCWRSNTVVNNILYFILIS